MGKKGKSIPEIIALQIYFGLKTWCKPQIGGGKENFAEKCGLIPFFFTFSRAYFSAERWGMKFY